MTLFFSLILLALNAFFVAAEFALVAAKRHRLEQAAAEGSRGARAALAGVRELSMMLAGAQLGITLCTLGLGALAKPAVAHLMEPAFESVGLPPEAAYGVAFVLAVAVVGFLHVVVGEMAPKSWSISHPEDSAVLLAPAFRAFTRMTRPALAALNGLANAALRLVRVEPQDELAQAHGPNELRMLIAASKEHGTLPDPDHDLLTAMLSVSDITVDRVMTPAERIVSVAPETPAREVELACRRAGLSRLAVSDDGRITGIVHLRDAIRATTAGHQAFAGELATPTLSIPVDTPVATAVGKLRDRQAQLAVVSTVDGGVAGLVALEDLLEELIGDFEDETDPVPGAARRR
ncbi:membrane protein [Virgisporangium aliadipatigenens]|uniref:Membrane protein n=1 Tax=Virgisporangium aliadipatigenens TaxID=741659 RepID=A0A8J3YIZ4_9ACTN|nr:hemolysin family protein [Virgisporangium aliadipatigenens]GIJ45991.1 membrane protein [Virgisporangium aliadipatigenens]